MRTLLLALGLLLIFAAPAIAAPTAGEPTPDETPVTQNLAEGFTSDSTDDGDPITSVVWDFGDGTTFTDDTVTANGVSNATHTFAASGPTTITVTVTDGTEQDTASNTIQVNAPPVASFTTTPSAPVAGQEILFESTSTDPDNDGFQNFQWDFDNDGDYEAEGSAPTATHTFATTGAKSVRLRVQDDDGSFDETTQTVNVGAAPPGNALPVARFSVSASNPFVGQQVSLESFAYDPDGSIVSERWDLDGDGDFDENVQGKNAFTTYTRPGPKIVRLEVRDSSGGVQTETRNITVRAQPIARRSGRLSLMSPFPVVHIVGSSLPTGARVKLLEVKGPRGIRVNVKCHGRDCPVKQVNKRKPRRKPARIRAFNRFLRAGTVLVVRVRKGQLIGKHARILIRGGKGPRITSRCLLPGKSRGSRCPRRRRS